MAGNRTNIKMIRALAECYQAFEQFSNKKIREFNLTPSQFDIIATLGNTDGFCCRELGEKTLITKGTLTSVLDRMIAKGLVERIVSPQDRRYQIVRLTPTGQTLFMTIFPEQCLYLDQKMAALPETEKIEITNMLNRLKTLLREDASHV